MLDLRSNLKRRVLISRSGKEVVISIRRHNYHMLYSGLLVFFTFIFIAFCSILIPAVLRIRSVTEVLYVAPFAGFVAVWYFLALRIGLWRVFGVETITLRDGTFRWTRKALWWTRGLEANQSEIANVVAKTPWHGLSNRVEIDVRGRTYQDRRYDFRR